MRYYEDEGYRDDDNRKKKKVKHSSNRPGQGMRIINHYEDYDYDDYFDDDVSVDDEILIRKN